MTRPLALLLLLRQMQYVKCLNFFQDLLKAKALERGRLLGLDVGDKYVGLAVSDLDNKIATPLSVLIRKKTNIDLMASDFQSLNLACFLFAKYITDVLTEHLISELSLVGFIVGYPFDRQQRAPDAVQVKLFIDDLSKTGKLDGVKYTFWNECFTSKNADLLLKPLSLHPILSKTIVDKFAAVQILQTYLDYGKKNVKLETAG
ncbi:Putative pre-16S rRNA nuclease - like 2 [Theobroma cacao]|nr:Putative pre-16S rRNA nuclease - like 2 [Theobroma cacao]